MQSYPTLFALFIIFVETDDRVLFKLDYVPNLIPLDLTRAGQKMIVNRRVAPLLTSLHQFRMSKLSILRSDNKSSRSIAEHPDYAAMLSDKEDSRLVALLNTSMPELLQQIPDMKDITEYWIIYPHKIQVPLHNDDLLYESNRNYSSALNLGEFPNDARA